ALGRIYVPRADLEQFGASLDDIRLRRATEGVRRCIELEVDRAQALFDEGRRLESLVPSPLARQLKLYRLGGEAILAAIRRQGFNPFAGRPVVSGGQKLRIALSVLAGRAKGEGGSA
ncbi:phytoene/squalene synthase family protein, partial [Alicyclobacillus sendaiensis]